MLIHKVYSKETIIISRLFSFFLSPYYKFLNLFRHNYQITDIEIKTILVTEYHRIGDVLIIAPVLKSLKKKFPKAKFYKDFRKMLEEMGDQIDAVGVGTPDHTHFAATMIAMELGMHVYVEKPLAHNIWQLRTLKKASKYYNIVSQMGNQGHTTDGIRSIKEWYEQGHLGQVTEVHAWHGKINFGPGKYFTMPDTFPPSIDPVPDYLDWDLWQGPAKFKPFNSTYAPRSWRGYYDYGNGLLGDWSCHTLDGPFWALDLGMPHTVTADVTNPRTEHNFVGDQSVVTMEFSARGSRAPVTLKWYEGPLPEMMPNNNPDWKIKKFDKSGMMMIGDKNTLVTGSRPNFGPKLAIENDIDSLWIGARSTVSPFIMQELADALAGTEKIILVKNPVNPDLALWLGGVERLYSAKIRKLGLIHRGFSTYEKTKFRNNPEWQLPIELQNQQDPKLKLILG